MRFFAAAAIAAMTIASANAAACDAAAGEKVFVKCKACHVADKGGPNKVGPNLFGVVGKKTGSAAGYNYSPAMKSSGKKWDVATLNAYLENPKAVIPATKMIFPGLKKPADRDNVICFLTAKK